MKILTNKEYRTLIVFQNLSEKISEKVLSTYANQEVVGSNVFYMCPYCLQCTYEEFYNIPKVEHIEHYEGCVVDIAMEIKRFIDYAK